MAAELQGTCMGDGVLQKDEENIWARDRNGAEKLHNKGQLNLQSLS
jgi:hypothetical protein